MKNEKKSVGRRGRKQGDGILKEMKPQSAALDNFKKLNFGRFADDPLAELVRELWAIWEQAQGLERYAEKIGKQQIEAAKDAQSNDDAAVVYWRAKAQNDSRYKDTRIDFEIAAREALKRRDANWFRDVAEIIEKHNPVETCYPLHAALMNFAPLNHTKNEKGLVCYPPNPSVNPKARYSIAEICGLLESQGNRPQGQSATDWRNTVRRACIEIGFPNQAKTDVREDLWDMRGQLQATVSDMEGKVDKAISNMNQQVTALVGESSKKPLIKIYNNNGPLDGQVLTNLTGSITLFPIYVKNIGQSRSGRISLRLCSTMSLGFMSGLDWREELGGGNDYPFSYRYEGDSASQLAGGIAAQDQIEINYFPLSLSGGGYLTNGLFNCKFQAFYDTEHPAEAKFQIKVR